MRSIGRSVIAATTALSLLAGACGCTEALKKNIYETCRLNAHGEDLWFRQFDLQFCDSLKIKAHLACSGTYISLEQTNVAKKSQYDGGISALKRDHLTIDPAADEIGLRYVSAAKERGSLVKMYRASINKKVVDIASRGGSNAFGYNASYSKFSDWDYALIEYSKDGRILSALARQQQVYTNASPYLQDSFSVIVFGARAKMFEQETGNIELLNAYIREI